MTPDPPAPQRPPAFDNESTWRRPVEGVSPGARLRRGFSRPVWLLGWVSFFTDTASEMIYPLLPLFVTRVLGAGAMSLGVIEGVAEAANSALKILSGWLADRSRQPKRLVLAGYGLSSAVRPLIAVAAAWPQVLTLRFADRLGKGIRSAPRDAMLAGYAPPDFRGRVFGFHRAMDHAGAVAGPLIASAFLFFYPGEFRTLFALTIVPGIVVILLILRLPPDGRAEPMAPSAPEPSAPEPSASAPSAPAPAPAPSAPAPSAPAPSAPAPFAPSAPSAPSSAPSAPSSAPSAPSSAPSAPSSADVRRAGFASAMIVIFVFSLGNASDAFLLLRLSDLGVAAYWLPLLWSALHAVKVVASFAGGAWSDRWGRRRLIAAGWLVYAMVYAGFGMFDTLATVIALFLVYGAYFGLTEGVEKAWVADMAAADKRGTAFGIYNAVLGIGSLAASLLFGWIWTRVSPSAAFFTGAALAVSATLLLYLMFSRRDAKTDPGYQR